MTEPVIEPDIMRMSWGPQHPMSGQPRILLDIDGEKVHRRMRVWPLMGC